MGTKGLPQGLRTIYCLLSLISFQVGSAFQINLQKLCDAFPQGWNETRYEVRKTREVSKFQHQTKLYSKCSTLLISFWGNTKQHQQWMAGNKKEHKKKKSTNTKQRPREQNRNTQPLWLTNKRNKPKLHRRKPKSHTEPQTSTYINTWCNQLWSND